MKDVFSEFYRPSEKEYGELFSKCLLVADANVLLDFYRVQEATREELFKIFAGFENRFWIPHQVALEFQRNRLTVRYEQRSAAYNIKKYLEKTKNQTVDMLQKQKSHAFIEIPSLVKEIKDFFARIDHEISAGLSAHPEAHTDDEIHARITALIGDKFGEAYPSKAYEQHIDDAKKRFKEKVPPGFADEREKEGDRKYGDYILWRQMMDKAKTEGKPIVFVTRDFKEDWVQEVGENTVGPLPELVAEMLRESGARFYIYETPQFMTYANSYLNEQVSQKAIDEVENLPDRVHLAQRARINRWFTRMLNPARDVPESYARHDFARYLIHGKMLDTFWRATPEKQQEMFDEFFLERKDEYKRKREQNLEELRLSMESDPTYFRIMSGLLIDENSQ